MLTYAGVLGVIIGGAIFLVALFSNPDSDPTCDSKVMSPGDICMSAGGGEGGRTYDEVKADYDDKKDGLYLGPSVLIVSIGVAALGSRFDESEMAAA